jgi:SAM-dependent methyltransferase
MALLAHQFGSTEHQATAKYVVSFGVKSWLGRLVYGKKARKPRSKYLQVGSGPNIRDDFENLDFYTFFHHAAKPVSRHDLRYPLPYADETFEGVFSEHCIEHLYPNHAIQLFRELWRVLKPGGVLRLTTPDLEKYINFYNGKDSDPLFGELYQSGCEAIWSLTQNWGHISVWDANMLTKKLTEVGFSQVTPVSYRVGRNPALILDKEDRRWETVYVEAVR